MNLYAEQFLQAKQLIKEKFLFAQSCSKNNCCYWCAFIS